MNLQVIASPDGDIVWVSGPLPGAVHDLTAARIRGIIAELAACGLLALGDKGYLGEDHIRTRTGAGTSPPRRRTPTGLTPGSAAPASAPMPSSNPGAPVSWPRPSTSCRPAKSEDEDTQPERASVRGGAGGSRVRS
jgi:DDE superfamily endonuclease